MNISTCQNNNRTSFGSVNLIQVSKKAFRTSEDSRATRKEFNTAVKTITGEANNKLGKILRLFGFGNNNKTVNFLEYHGYERIVEELKKIGDYSLSWFSQHKGLPIAGPLHQDYHSFTVLTKEHKNAANPLFSLKNMFQLGKNVHADAKARLRNGEKVKIDSTWSLIRTSQLFSEQIRAITDGEPVHKFVIDDLSELPKVFEQIDY